MGQVTVSGVSVLIFGNQEGAKTYWQTALGGDPFLSADSNTQKQALVSVTRWLLREGLCSQEGVDILPSADDADVPDEVLQAAYELSSVIIADPEASSSNAGQSNTKRLKAGSAEVEFFKPQAGFLFPSGALKLLLPYLKTLQNAGSQTSTGVGNLASGTDRCSHYESTFGRTSLNKGYP